MNLLDVLYLLDETAINKRLTITVNR